MNLRVTNVNGYGNEVKCKCKHGDVVRLEDWKMWCRACGALAEFKSTTFAGPPYTLEWSVPKRDWEDGGGDDGDRV
jgi:hypothetical protein